ncbi:MAG: esterase-like activity of phytase family protein [Vicinamibacterales bacterium]
MSLPHVVRIAPRRRCVRGVAGVVVLGLVLLAGCAPRSRAPSAVPASPVRLSLVGSVVFPPGDLANRLHVLGSVSGLARDPVSGRYLAAIDDRQPARLVWLDVRYDGALHVVPGDIVTLTPGPGTDARRVTAADLEGLAALPDGTFVASEEGHRSTGAPGQPPAGDWPIALISIDRALTATRIDEWPAAFALGPAGGGLRDNQGAEALTATPDGRLIAGLEQPLYTDADAMDRNGRPFGGGRGGPGRLVEFVRTGSGWSARRQWIYPIAPTAVREGLDDICDDGENGLTDVLALDTTRFLSLERACLVDRTTRRVRNTVVVSLVDVSSADDVSGLASARGATARPAAKTPVLDFDTLISSLPPELALLDNFEALAFGPPLPDGTRTLLVASDDNFRATQHTAFLLFSINF